MIRRTALALSAALAATCAPALAWGTAGHTDINTIAAAELQGRVPAFVTTPAAQFEISYLGPEPDRLKGSGESWDADYDQGHFLDVLDDGTVAGVVRLSQLPASRAAYDAALQTAHTNQYKQGFLPYSILDGWEQLRSDFAYWQVDSYAATHNPSPQIRKREAAIAVIDQQQTLEDIGMWGHYVGDASQPLHVTVHYNGWGDYPNPNGYTESRRTHSDFESVFVNKFITPDMVRAATHAQSSFPEPQALLSQDEVLKIIGSYLQTTANTVPQVYTIEKAGGFENGSADAKAFVASRLAAGAMELRDLTVLAWQDSKHARVGYPYASVSDVLSGRAPWPQGGRD